MSPERSCPHSSAGAVDFGWCPACRDPFDRRRYCPRCFQPVGAVDAYCFNNACQLPRPEEGWMALPAPFAGGYRLQLQLGLNPLGVAFLAQRPPDAAVVVVQVLHRDEAPNAEALERVAAAVKGATARTFLAGDQQLLRLRSWSAADGERPHLVLEFVQTRALERVLGLLPDPEPGAPEFDARRAFDLARTVDRLLVGLAARARREPRPPPEVEALLAPLDEEDASEPELEDEMGLLDTAKVATVPGEGQAEVEPAWGHRASQTGFLAEEDLLAEQAPDEAASGALRLPAGAEPRFFEPGKPGGKEPGAGEEFDEGDTLRDIEITQKVARRQFEEDGEE